MDSILDDLNPAQCEAVMHGEGPLIVLAGAGSGKTRVITRRVARLLRDGVPPAQVLALTFTNKAAGEMARRVEELGVGRVWVSTFHSACARFLRRDSELIGFPRDFSIYDTYDRDTCIKMLMHERGLDTSEVKPARAGRRISQLKNLDQDPGDVLLLHEPVDRVVKEIWEPYQALLKRLGAMDFDDLLGHFLVLLADHPHVAESYQERFRWILVDEFQDTNRVQHRLTTKLSAAHRNLCVVGDPDQSIYSFRGADIRNLLDFEVDFPDAVTIRMETNYRSTACILRAAEALISNNTQRFDKSLRTDNAEGELIAVRRCVGPAQEAREIAARIESLVRGGVSPDEVAIFYRSHFLSRALEEGLREVGIPYEVIGGVSFFERREIKDLLAYLRVLVNPIDDLSMERIINVPPRGIGKVTLEKLRALAAENRMSLFEVIGDGALRERVPRRARKSLAELASVFEELRPLVRLGAHPVLNGLMERIEYLDYVGDIGDPEDVARVENVEELHTDAAFFDREIGGGLVGYLQHVSLMTSEDRSDPDEERVSMMTVHAAKGLEFDYVIVAGLEEDLFPHIRSLEVQAGLEEERRLMYVALTRARERVWLHHCESRMVSGYLQRQDPSRFLSEIPADCKALSAEGWDGLWDQTSESTFETEVDYSQEALELGAGCRVVHPLYGRGTVVRLMGSGLQAKATVQFDRAGERVLVLEYAHLQLLPEGEEGS